MLVEIPDDLAARAEEEAQRTGRPIREVIAALLERAADVGPPLGPMDDDSEDTLNAGEQDWRGHLSAGPDAFVLGTGEPLVRPADRHITCARSVSDAVLEGRG